MLDVRLGVHMAYRHPVAGRAHTHAHTHTHTHIHTHTHTHTHTNTARRDVRRLAHVPVMPRRAEKTQTTQHNPKHIQTNTYNLLGHEVSLVITTYEDTKCPLLLQLTRTHSVPCHYNLRGHAMSLANTAY